MSAAQGTAAWLAERCGCATTSRYSGILATIKNGEAATRKNYRAQLVAERLTGIPAESSQSKEMLWGTEQEPYARMAYEARTGLLVVEQGFIKHPACEWAGASPDGFVGDDGGVEFKCPNTATHIDALLKGMPSGHIPQIQGCMWVCGRQWWDFVSFDSRMPEKLQLYTQRIVRDDVYIAKLAAEVQTFLAEVEATRKQLMEISDGS